MTLLFSQEVYEQVAEAYMAGLEQLAASGGDLSKMASVASFFISRIDSPSRQAVEQDEDNQRSRAANGFEKPAGQSRHRQRQTGVPELSEFSASDRWKRLAAKGAQTQRVLWASTSTKNPAYPDVMYIEELIGPDTVNTIPPATLDAYRDHGHPRLRLTENIADAKNVMKTLPKVGISIKEVTDKLTDDGVKLFSEAFDKLLKAIEKNSN